MISLSPFGILAAGVTPVLLGMVWYHPRLFGTHWMQMSGITPEMAERIRGNRLKYTLLALLTSIVIAYVMDTFCVLAHVTNIAEALWVAGWSWTGFVMPVLLGSIIWEGRSVRLYCINVGYWFTAFISMAVLLFALSFS